MEIYIIAALIMAVMAVFIHTRLPESNPHNLSVKKALFIHRIRGAKHHVGVLFNDSEWADLTEAEMAPLRTAYWALENAIDVIQDSGKVKI